MPRGILYLDEVIRCFIIPQMRQIDVQCVFMHDSLPCHVANVSRELDSGYIMHLP